MQSGRGEMGRGEGGIMNPRSGREEGMAGGMGNAGRDNRQACAQGDSKMDEGMLLCLEDHMRIPGWLPQGL